MCSSRGSPHALTIPYGKTLAERETILRYVEEVEPLLRASATIEIDASAPLEDVVSRLEQLG
jgi:hypothetical protein